MMCFIKLMTNTIISEISLSIVHLKFEQIIMTIFIHINTLGLQKLIIDVRARRNYLKLLIYRM